MRFSCLVVTAVAMLTAGCRPQQGCQGDRCSVAVIASGADADVLLPPVTSHGVSIAINELIYLRLADIGAALSTVGDEGFVPKLAQSWAFEDSVTITFSLHPDAVWHDGRSVTAADVAFTYDLYRDTIVGAPVRSQLEPIVSVTARDERTVEFRFARSYPEQFFDATYHVSIVPKHVLDTVPRDQLRNHPAGHVPVGNGPYRFAEWRRGEFIRLVADPAFFLGAPGIRELVWRVTGDQAASVNQLLTGEADIIETVVDPDLLARVRSSDHLRTFAYPAPAYGYLGFNFADPEDLARSHPLFSNHDLRRAIALGIDKRTVVEAVFGDNAAVPIGATGRAVWIWSEEIEQIAYDADAARQTLDGLGWTVSDGDGIRRMGNRRLSFGLLVPASSGVRRRSAVIVQEQLRQIGVDVELIELEFNDFIERATTGRFDAVFGGWALDPTPRGMRDLWTTAGIGGNNWGRYSNPEIDRLFEQALVASTMEEARERWRTVLQSMNEDVPAVWLFEPNLTAVVEQRFTDVSIRPDRWSADLWKWRIR